MKPLDNKGRLAVGMIEHCPHCRRSHFHRLRRYTARLRYYDDAWEEGIELRVCASSSMDAAELAAERWEATMFDDSADLLVVVTNDSTARLTRYRVRSEAEIVFHATEEDRHE